MPLLPKIESVNEEKVHSVGWWQECHLAAKSLVTILF